MGSISKKYVNSAYLTKNISKIVNEKVGKIIIFEERHANNTHFSTKGNCDLTGSLSPHSVLSHVN